jgi:flavin reductase (DIM6/NTAB) family NADH-FMN oxidoreductase RutF
VTSEQSQQPLDTSQFDVFVEGLDYPMFVVTTCAQERAGCLVGFTTQASIDPPRLLVCLSVQNHTYRVARDAAFVAVHVLGPDEHRLARLFGEQTGDRIDKFAQCSWRPGPAGVPLLEDCPRFVVGRVLEQIPLGDHVGFLLEPVAVDSSSSVPGLTFEDVEDMSPGHPA